ncbi:MAG: DUF2726 domain-containing protein [Desulfitobacteriaceae bacterium]
MNSIVYVIVGVLIIYIVFEKVKGNKEIENSKNMKVKENEKLPYKVKDDFLTDTERSFYHSLKLCVGDKAVICPKVGLKDIFFVDKGVGKDYMKYFGKIAQKHVDFLLCDPGTMKPICGVELDDISHTNKKSHARDLFVEKVYNDANFELIRLSSKYTYKEIEIALTGVFDRPQEIPVVQSNNETVLCPKCSIPMVLRKSTKGQNAGREFYGCTNYPQCKQVINSNI